MTNLSFFLKAPELQIQETVYRCVYMLLGHIYLCGKTRREARDPGDMSQKHIDATIWASSA